MENKSEHINRKTDENKLELRKAKMKNFIKGNRQIFEIKDNFIEINKETLKILESKLFSNDECYTFQLQALICLNEAFQTGQINSLMEKEEFLIFLKKFSSIKTSFFDIELMTQFIEVLYNMIISSKDKNLKILENLGICEKVIELILQNTQNNNNKENLKLLLYSLFDFLSRNDEPENNENHIIRLCQNSGIVEALDYYNQNTEIFNDNEIEILIGDILKNFKREL